MNLSEDDLSRLDDWLLRRGPDCLEGRVLEDGAEFGPFKILGLLGRGGSAEVCRAFDRSRGTVVALKVPHRGDRAGAERFRREARLLSDHPHPALPRLVDSGEENGIPWLAIEELRPGDLPSSPRKVARFLLSLCEGVAHLHALGLVHRDVKPGNILYRADGQPVLIDLGLVKDASIPPVPLPADAPLSVVGSRAVGFGTPGYAAPEQFASGDISPAADVYALGMLALRCFGGRPPLCWRSVLRRATAPLPADRYPDAAAFARALRRRRRGFAHAIAAGIAVVLVVSGSAAFFSYEVAKDRAAESNFRLIMWLARSGALPSNGARTNRTTSGSAVSPARADGDRESAPSRSDKRVSSWVPRYAPELAKCLGLSNGKCFTPSDHPWEVDPDDPTGIRGGVSGEIGEADFFVLFDGPARVSFRYSCHFPGKKTFGDSCPIPSAFFVEEGNRRLLFDADGDDGSGGGNGEFRDVSFKLPAGSHFLQFSYRHGGTGYPDQFNGVRLRDLKIEKTSSDSPPTDKSGRPFKPSGEVTPRPRPAAMAPRPAGNLPPSSSFLYPATALAERLGLPSGGWLTSSDYPWEADPDDPSGVRSGISGGVGESVLSIPVEGPARVSFRYFRHFPGKKMLGDRDRRPSSFSVFDGETTLLFDPEGDKNYTDQLGDPCDASFDLPAGHHSLRFVYRHGGSGYINHFNGIRLRDLKIEKTSSDSPPAGES